MPEEFIRLSVKKESGVNVMGRRAAGAGGTGSYESKAAVKTAEAVPLPLR